VKKLFGANTVEKVPFMTPEFLNQEIFEFIQRKVEVCAEEEFAKFRYLSELIATGLLPGVLAETLFGCWSEGLRGNLSEVFRLINGDFLSPLGLQLSCVSAGGPAFQLLLCATHPKKWAPPSTRQSRPFSAADNPLPPFGQPYDAVTARLMSIMSPSLYAMPHAMPPPPGPQQQQYAMQQQYAPQQQQQYAPQQQQQYAMAQALPLDQQQQQPTAPLAQATCVSEAACAYESPPAGRGNITVSVTVPEDFPAAGGMLRIAHPHNPQTSVDVCIPAGAQPGSQLLLSLAGLA
jgi:hypothetical protein